MENMAPPAGETPTTKTVTKSKVNVKFIVAVALLAAAAAFAIIFLSMRTAVGDGISNVTTVDQSGIR